MIEHKTSHWFSGHEHVCIPTKCLWSSINSDGFHIRIASCNCISDKVSCIHACTQSPSIYGSPHPFKNFIACLTAMPTVCHQWNTHTHTVRVHLRPLYAHNTSGPFKIRECHTVYINLLLMAYLPVAHPTLVVVSAYFDTVSLIGAVNGRAEVYDFGSFRCQKLFAFVPRWTHENLPSQALFRFER